jgi:hypothetical protein
MDLRGIIAKEREECHHGQPTNGTMTAEIPGKAYK